MNSSLRAPCFCFLAVVCFLSATALPGVSFAEDREDGGQSVQFNRDIRPIFSDNCFRCHGPDSETRKAELRLDDASSVFQQREGGHTLVPGDLAGSELYRRITAEDESERMPPAGSGRSLTAKERDLIKRWIEQGAKYEPHWSFVTLRRPVVPRVKHKAWPQNPIDNFVLSRLEREGWQPSPPAERRRLMRRVTLDLTGLPPTPREVRAFLADASPTAYGNLVDRLLASPRYGERMALEWLDAARYADTHGYLFDTERTMWRWRDWVITAFNRNQPFDQFTVEQLAGDLFPNPDLSQRIATGFNRNHIINNEAGAIPEEYFVENIVDRIDTTATVWMGLTFACAQCHDHKYDPISQREYYQLYAFFNNVREVGLDGFNSNAKPLIKAPTSMQLQQIASLDRQIAGAEQAISPLKQNIPAAQDAWEQEFYQPVQPVFEGLTTHLPLDGSVENRVDLESKVEVKQGSSVHEAGLFDEAISLDGQRYVELGHTGDFDAEDSFSLSAWVYPTLIKGRRSLFSKMEPANANFRGYTLQLIGGMASLILVHAFPDDLMQVQAKTPVEANQWHHILAIYDGSGKVDGVKLYVDGKRQEVGIKIDKLTGSVRTEKPLFVGKGYPAANFQGRIDDVRIFDRALSENEVSRLPGLSVHSLIAVPKTDRGKELSTRIRNYYLEHAAPKKWRAPYQQLVRLRLKKKETQRGLPTVMVMQERDKPRETKILIRGAYDRPGETVTAATPAFLPPLNHLLPRNRLGLARWLTDPAHPLTARVTVNRYWQTYFGTGLVRTAENFGLQGEWPSHPALLDWLASEFLHTGWNVKAMQRLIVTSATYQQSSAATQRLLKVDPENRLLTRGPRYRLSAELIRDQALAVSGLLVERPGGPSVKPYQPPNLWKEIAFDVTGKALTAQIYEQGHAEALYRRSMYTFWKRTAPPPSMLIFDGPNRERCVVRRDRTNTPLQALVLMNDPTYVEAARKLAERMLTEGQGNAAEHITRGFQLTLCRTPSHSELDIMLSLLEQQLARFASDTDAARKLLQVGESAWNKKLSVQKLAAYSVIAGVLLTLDETVTKG